MIHLSMVDKEMSGKYRCEITIENKFFTMSKDKYMEVLPPTTTTTIGKLYKNLCPITIDESLLDCIN